MIGTVVSQLGQLARRPLFLALAIFGLILLTLSIVYASFYFPARARLNAAIAEARERGEPVWFSDLDPGPERNPSEDAKQLLALCKQLEMSDEDRSIISDAERIVRHGITEDLPEVTEQEYQRIEEISATNAALLSQIGELLRRDECWFECDYATESPWYGALEYQDTIGRIETCLHAQMVTALRTKNETLALATVGEYLDLPAAVAHDPTGVLSYHYLALGHYFRGIMLLKHWSNVAPWSNKAAMALESLLSQAEQRYRIGSQALNNRASALTTMANLQNEDNQEVLDMVLESPEEFPEWLENMLSRDASQRQLTRWSTFPFRPWIMEQQTFLIEVTHEQSRWADEVGPHAAEVMKAIDNKVKAASGQMPLCDADLFTFSADRNLGMSLRQSMINGGILLRLSQEYDEQAVTSEELVADVEAAIQDAPVGYLSGEPVEYRIENFTVTLFDTRPTDQEEFGHFTLRLFQPLGTEAAESSEAD